MKKAFTLIELMIVVAIIAIIAAIAIPNLMESKKSANESNGSNNLNAYLTAQSQYQSGNYSYTNIAQDAANTRCFAQSFEFLGGSAAGDAAPHVDGNGDDLALLKGPVADACDAGTAYNGYFFEDITADASGGFAATNWKYRHGAAAAPAVYGQTGVSQFMINAEGVVYQQDTGDNTVNQTWPADPEGAGWAPK